MKKQLILMSALAIVGFTACNDNNSTTDTTKTDSSATVSTPTTNAGERRGTEIANFASRTFMDLKTNKPVKLRWNTEKYYYEDESGNQPYYYYDPAAHDTFDYWGRRLNSYLTYNNGDYTLDESRMTDMSTNDASMDTSTMSTSGDNTKIKAKDDKYKEKTDDSKMKVKDDKMKVKDK